MTDPALCEGGGEGKVGGFGRDPFLPVVVIES